MILSAKISGSGYEVTYNNGDILSVPNADGNRHYNELMKWVEKGGVIGAEFTTKQKKEKKEEEEFQIWKAKKEKDEDKKLRDEYKKSKEK